MTVSHGYFYRAVAAAVVALVCAMPLFAQEKVCAVKGIMGNVKVLSARDKGKADLNDVTTWPDARMNMALREKDMIATLAESEVRLETADGSTVRLRENTVLELASLKDGGAAHTKIRIIDGSIVTNVKKMMDGRTRFEFETPTAVAAIRGTNVEIESRKKHGTTVKTFDGALEVSGAKNKKKRAKVGDYQMVEIETPKSAATVRTVPKNYRPKTTKLLSEEDMSKLTGFRRVILTQGELEEVVAQLERDGIAAAIGVGESNDEQTARTMSADAGRTELAKAMEVQVQRLSESYTQNIDGEAKTIWEEAVRQITDVSLRGSVVHSTVTRYSKAAGTYRVYSLIKVEPERFKDIFAAEVERHEELELRVKKDDVMKRMDAAIKAYDTKYHDR